MGEAAWNGDRQGPNHDTRGGALWLEHLASVAEGGDPLVQRHSTRSAISVGELCDLYIEEAEKRRKALIKEGRGAPRKG